MSVRLPIALVLAGCLLACGPGKFLVPRNESEEPVFRRSHFASAGGSGGASTKAGYHLLPLIWCEARVAPWASFTNLPLYWNFLLSGDQYDGGGVLLRERLHLSLHGGLSGLAYSSRDGWAFPGDVVLQGKYLSGRWFLVPALGLDIHDLREGNSLAGRGSLALGLQADDRNSLRLAYGIARYLLPAGSRLEHRGLSFRDGDSRSDLQLRHSLYLAGRHVLGPEAGVSLRHRDPAGNLSLSAGLHYRYVFD